MVPPPVPSFFRIRLVLIIVLIIILFFLTGLVHRAFAAWPGECQFILEDPVQGLNICGETSYDYSTNVTGRNYPFTGSGWTWESVVLPAHSDVRKTVSVTMRLYYYESGSWYLQDTFSNGGGTHVSGDTCTVYTNIEGINEPACLEMIKVVVGMSDCGLARHLHFLSDDQLGDFWNHVEPGSLIVLDEVQNIFSSRNWQSQENIGMNAWASTHRHHGFDVVLITQDIMRLDTAVRSLVEWTYVYRKVNFFGSFVQKSYIRHAYAGENTSGQALGKNIRKYEDRIFRCYRSYVAADIKEVGIMKHTNVLKHPIFFVIPVVFVVFIVLFFRSGFVSGDLFGADQIIEKSGKEVSGSAASAPAVPDSYSVHTPSIYRTSRDGRVVFSNRRTQPENVQ